MIHLHSSQINNLEGLFNKVLIKPNRRMDEMYLSNGIKLTFNPDYEKGMHIPTVGEVICVPTELRFTNDVAGWIGKIEVQKGDIAYFGYKYALESLEATEENNIVDEEGQLYFWIEYAAIYCVTEMGKNLNKWSSVEVESEVLTIIKPVNGYHIVVPILDPVDVGSLVLPEKYREKHSSKIGQVLFAPQSKVEYFKHDNDTGLATGEIAPQFSNIVFDRYSDLPVENEMHRTLLGGKKLFYVHQRDVMGIVESI